MRIPMVRPIGRDASHGGPALPTDYQDIYDHVISSEPRYNAAENSPGYAACLMWSDRIRAAGSPALDVGCGVGFVVQLLSGNLFGLESYGTDISRVAVERAAARTSGDRVRLMEGERIPFADGQFGLVTCFDVLEHIDESDVVGMRDELRRVLRAGGLLFCTASCRPAGMVDQHGENLHRTVRGPEWWAERFTPDEYLVRRAHSDVVMWWRKP